MVVVVELINGRDIRSENKQTSNNTILHSNFYQSDCYINKMHLSRTKPLNILYDSSDKGCGDVWCVYFHSSYYSDFKASTDSYK